MGDLDINSNPGTGVCQDPGPQQVGPHCWKKVAAAILVETRLGKLCPPPPLLLGRGGTSRFTVVSRNPNVSWRRSVYPHPSVPDFVYAIFLEYLHIWLNLIKTDWIPPYLTVSHRILPILTKYQISPYVIKSQNLSKSHQISHHISHRTTTKQVILTVILECEFAYIIFVRNPDNQNIRISIHNTWA